MSEHLRALIVILAAAFPVFWLARKPMTASLMTNEQFSLRRNLWITVTLIAFLSHNYWIYVFLCAVVLLVYGKRDPNPLALYCMLLFAAPSIDMQLPGFGLVNYVFDVNHIRLLNLFVLLPFAIRLAGGSGSLDGNGSTTQRSKVLDWMVIAYLALLTVLQMQHVNFTSLMRGVFYSIVDIWIPYYIASRSLRQVTDFRHVAACFVLAVVVMVPMAAFEAAKGWLLYDGLPRALGAPQSSIGVYILRGEGGMLRANVAAGNSIVLGYFMMVAIVFSLFIGRQIPSKKMFIALMGALFLGLIAALSRGPWVATAIALTTALCLGPGGGRRLALLTGLGGAAFALLLISPWGGSVIDHLPFVGTVDEGSVTYRQQLFDVSMMVLWQNPIFGAFDYILNPAMEQMRQGQGIIDMVNTYLAVALPYGLTGLLLFVLPFGYVLTKTFLVRRAYGKSNPEVELLGRSLLGVVIGIMVTIATVSSIGAVPAVYWVVIGICAAYIHRYGGSNSSAASAVNGPRPVQRASWPSGA